METGFLSEIFSSFQGEGLFAGRRHVFMRMAGCNLRCSYCDTPESLVRTPDCAVQNRDGSQRRVKNPLDAGEVSALLAPLLGSPGVHALAITGGEPLLQSSFLAELLAAARPEAAVLLETNGSYPARLAEVLAFIDIVSMDVKLPSNSGEAPLWDEHREFVRLSLGKTLYVKVPVDETTLDDEVRAAASLVADADPTIAFFLQPILSPGAEVRISAPRLERFYDIAAERLADVRVLPQTHRFLGIR
ncbi:MAG: 7-carboxy-7-deazaguanine synthase QueE [Candidatus Binatia bacterium]